ncbi:MAG: M20/M25/M40 family metallo-hydrolase, partial [Acidobacteria bacterium]|nr:M20/M25/M40 family metallo-hydrolase [Acidobacteriota bacterium]
MNPQQILDYFKGRKESTVGLISEFVNIESPSFDVARSKKAVDWLERNTSGISPGFDTERIYAEGFGDHFKIRAFQNSDLKPIFILGHSDTVHPIGSIEKNPTRIENGKLFGCGTFDMKANIVVMLEVFRFFTEHNLSPKRQINVLISCDEEVGSDTGRQHVEDEGRKAEYCFVFEPSAEGKVKTGRKGTGSYTLKTHGIPSHAGLDPEKGASAILEISRQIEKLHSLTDFSVGTTISVGMIKGGTAMNVVPAEAECSIDVRFETMDEANRIEHELGNLESFDKRVSLELLGAINRPPLERTDGVVDLFEKAKAAAQTFGYDLKETQVG